MYFLFSVLRFPTTSIAMDDAKLLLSQQQQMKKKKKKKKKKPMHHPHPLQLCLFFPFLCFLSLPTLCGAAARTNRSSSAPLIRPRDAHNAALDPPKLHTLFSVECNDYFDWQTIGLMNSYWRSGHPGPITRLLSCTNEDLKKYRGMDLAPTHVVPSMSHHPKTGDWYPAINKPAGVVHWIENSEEARDVDWVVILDADMVIRHPILPWKLGAEKGKPVAALYGYLIGCDNILAKLHTIHPELCDKVGGLLGMHMDDLRALAPLWLSKTEEVRADKEHWSTNITGDIYGQGWISEMYGYSFGAAEVGLHHHISNDLMLYPGYVPREGTEPILLHYGLRFSVGNWSFSKADHYDDNIAYDCNRIFPPPPYPKEVLAMESDPNKRRALLLSIECMNTLNEGLLHHHKTHGCSNPRKSKYISFLAAWRKATTRRSEDSASNSTKDVVLRETESVEIKKIIPELIQELSMARDNSNYTFPKIHTLFSVECSTYFDWQTVGLMHSFEASGQPGSITRLLSCNDEDLKKYKGLDLAPTHLVPSYSLHPLTHDWYPAINKPVAVLHWLNHVTTDAEFLVILDADMILRKPITPWEFGAEKGHPVSAPYDYLIGCDNLLARLHTRYPEACDKVGGVIIMHIDDLREFAPLWLHKTEEVRADKAHWNTSFTGDIYGQGWISEMYGYSFGAAELKLRHRIRNDMMLYPGYVPLKDTEPSVLHYGIEFSVGTWRFNKADWHSEDMTNACWKFFPDPPDPSSLTSSDVEELRKDKISIECVRTLNNALYLHHKRRGCPHPTTQTMASNGIQDHNATERVTVNVTQSGAQSYYGNIDRRDIGRIGLVNKQRDEELERRETGESISMDKGGKPLLNFGVKAALAELVGASKSKNGLLGGAKVYWMLALLWSLVVFFFLLIVYSVYSRDKHMQRSLKAKTRRRPERAALNGSLPNKHGPGPRIVC